MTFIPEKPMHRAFLFRNLSDTQYKVYAKQYSNVKATGIRGIYAWMSGVGVYGIVTDLGKGVVVNYGKRQLATACITACGYVFSTAVVVVTNATKVVKYAKQLHCATSFIFECVEDSSNLGVLPIDIMLFGQPIPIGRPNRFNLFTNTTDFLDFP